MLMPRLVRVARLSVLFALLPQDLSAQKPVFDAPVLVFPQDVYIEGLLDFDADGNTDAVGVWWPDNATILYRGFRNTGAGGFTQAWSFTRSVPPRTSWPFPTTIAVGNLDGQGPRDFVTWENGFGAASGFVSGYACQLNGAPTLAWNKSTAGIEQLQLADFDADGLDDIVYTSTGSGTLTMLHANASSAPTVAATLPLGTPTIRELKVARIDGDAVPDVVVVDAYSLTQVYFVPGTATGFGTPATFAMANTIQHLVVGDIDGDGDNDVVAFHYAGTYTTLRNQAGALVQEPLAVGGPASDFLDVDGDGDLDGACCGGGGFVPFAGYDVTYMGALDAIMRVAINDGAGHFAVATTIPNAYAMHLAGGADFDHDGHMDLVAGRSVMFGGPESAAATHPVLPALVSGSGADADGDGDIDFNVGTYPSGVVNYGDGHFEPMSFRVPPAFASLPSSVGDWDGDGDVDLLVHQYYLTPATSRLLTNLGNGVFVDSGLVSATSTINSLRGESIAADFDSDGDLDLISPDLNLGCQVFLNNGAGQFTAGPQFPVVPIAVVDFDRDVIQDLLGVANQELVVRYGRGSLNGTAWLAPGQAPIPWRPFAPGFVVPPYDFNSVADADGDGDLDVLAATTNGIYLYLNDGAGHLAAGALVDGTVNPLIYRPRLALIADVDSDGIADLVTSRTNEVSIRLGLGGGQFQPPRLQAMGELRTPVDLDGDGDLDLVTYGTGYSYVYWNRTYEGPSAGTKEQIGTAIAGTPSADLVLGERAWLHSDVLGYFAGEIRIRGGIPGNLGALGIGLAAQPTPLFGGTLYTDPIAIFEFFLGGTPGVPGSGHLEIPWTLGTWAAGLEIVIQVGVVDPLAPQGVALSNAVRKTMGF